MVPIAVLKLYTGRRYGWYHLHCALLDDLIPGSCFSNEEMDVNLTLVRMEVRFGEVASMQGLMWYH